MAKQGKFVLIEISKEHKVEDQAVASRRDNKNQLRISALKIAC